MWSIRSNIFYRIILILSLSAAFFGAFLLVTARKIIRDIAEKDGTRFVAYITENFRNHFDNGLKDLDDLAALCQKSNDNGTCIQHSENFLAYRNAIFNTIYLYDSDLKLIKGLKKGEPDHYRPAQKLTPGDKNILQTTLAKAVNEKKAQISSVVADADNDFFLIYAVPIFKPKSSEIRAVLSGAIFPQRRSLEGLIRGLELSENNFVIISDHQGRIVGESGTQIVHEKGFFPQLWSRIHKTKEDKSIWVELDNRAFQIFSSDVYEVGFHIMYGVDGDVIAAKDRAVTRSFLILIAISSLVSLISSVFIANRIVFPLQMIAKKVESLNQGIFETKGTYENDDEFSYVMKNLDNIGQKIEQGKYLGELWNLERKKRHNHEHFEG